MTKQYSADAIIERDYQAQLNRVPEKKEEVEKPTPLVNPLTPPVNDYQRSLGSDDNNFLLSQSNPTNIVADTEDWDYRTAKTNRQGEVPLTVRLGDWSLKPQGFTPNGDAYFGQGIGGWFKKLAYNTLEIAMGDEEKQQQYKDQITEGYKKLKEANYGLTFANPLDQEAIAEQQENTAEDVKNIVSGAWDVISGYWGSASTDDSVLAAPVKVVNLTVKTVVDAFTVLADTVESALAMNKTMRRYAEEHGSQMPDLGVADFDPIKISEEYVVTDELLNTFSRNLLLPLQVYDSVKFWTSEGTLQEKVDALKLGWTEGRMLYTELVKPTVEAEFLLRVKAGENPDLLVMEMQDPYAELVGELFIDPTFLIAGSAKAAKFANLVETAGDLGGVTDKVTDLLKTGSQGSTAAQYSAHTDEIVKAVQSYDYSKAVRQVQYNNLFKLNAKGLQTKVSKSMSEFTMWVAGSVKKAGGTPDDIADVLSNLYKLSSKNAEEVKSALDFINKTKMVNNKVVFFGQHALETSHVMRKLVGEAGDIKKKLTKLKNSSWDEQAKILTELIGDSTKAAIPTITDMSQASRRVGKLDDVTKNLNRLDELKNQLKTAGKSDVKKIKSEISKLEKTLPSNADVKLAKDYADLAKQKPALVTLARFDEELVKFWSPANSFFSGVYFSRYGFAARQYISNNFMVFKEGGLSAFWRDGGYKTMTQIESELARAFPAGLPWGIEKPKSVIDSADMADNLIKQMFDKFKGWKYSPQTMAEMTERASGVRVFYKYYRDTMDKMMDFGRGLPKQEEWVARGFTPEMAKDYKTILQSNGYDVEQASKAFRQQYANGTDLFRDLSWIREDTVLGLKDYGGWDNLVNFVKNPEIKTKEQIKDFIDNLIDDSTRRANQTNNNINAVSNERAADHLEKFGGDAPEIVGFREIQTHIDNAHQVAKEAFKQDFTNALSIARKEFSKLSNEISTTGKAKPEQVQRMTALDEWITKANQHISQADEIAKQNSDLLKQLKRSLDDWMSENKSLKYGEGERETRWQEWYKAVDDANEEYFGFYNVGGVKIQDDYSKIMGADVQEVFKASRQATVDVQKAKTIVSSKRGGLFHTLPNELTYTTPGQNRHDLNIRDLAKAFGISTQKNNLLNIVNKGSVKKYTNLTDITLEDAQKIFQDKVSIYTDVVKGLKNGNPPAMPGSVVDDARGLIPASPIHPGGSAGFNDTHAWAAGKEELEKALRYIENGLIERLGRKGEDILTDSLNSTLDEFTQLMASRADEAHLSATKVGQSYRDFALHPYGETTHFDHALQFVLSYHFWSTRTFANFAKSLVTNADMIAAYGKWKDHMAQQYADMPEWYKYNIKFPDFLGINEGNPYLVNLESVINPMYGLTGTDFNNPQKRANWFTATIDDLGKFGPSVFAPISMAIAAYYSSKGQDEVSAAWGTRMFAQTATLKAVSSLFGTPIEVDPNVHLFQQGLDPYEEDRISRALAAMSLEGYDQQQLMEAARTHEGDLWNEAYRRANVERAPGQILSSLLIGFRPRTEEDMQIEQFYEDYGRVRNMHDAGLMSDEDYKQSFNELREAYPFMDVILLSRRSGVGREEAYAYNVISRIPPGMTSEIYEKIGVDPRTAEKFFDSGGKTEGMSETEKEDFINAFINAGALLAIPSNATRREWIATKSMYSEMEKALQRDFGEDILDDISRFYRLETKDERDAFTENNPQVSEALDERQAYIVNNPQLMKFYGGIETLDRYYESKMYDELEKKFGSDIAKIEDAYYDEYDPAIRKSILRQHPELKQYWNEKSRLKEENLRKVVEFGAYLNEPDVEWTGNQPENPKQEDLLEFMQTPKITYQQWEGIIGQPMSELIQDYWYNGEELPPIVMSGLEYLATQNGFQNEDDMLREILLSLQVTQ